MAKAKGIFMLTAVLVALIFLLITVNSVQAATIQGKVYGPGLEIVQKAIVAINSTPRQNIVAAEGTYLFIVPQGTYDIESFYTSRGNLIYAKETITVPQEGSFTLDLILFETPDIEDIDFDESELKMIEDLLKQEQVSDFWLIAAAIAAGLIIAAIFAFLLTRKFLKKYQERAKLAKKHKKFKAKAVKGKFEEEKPVGDEAMAQTLAILKREKRVTQKDIRRELKISEAKASLIIADLETQGKVKKIKRGRGNIILYQE